MFPVACSGPRPLSSLAPRDLSGPGEENRDSGGPQGGTETHEEKGIWGSLPHIIEGHPKPHWSESTTHIILSHDSGWFSLRVSLIVVLRGWRGLGHHGGSPFTWPAVGQGFLTIGCWFPVGVSPQARLSSVTFSSLALEVSQHHFCPIPLVKSKSLGLGSYVQGERDKTLSVHGCISSNFCPYLKLSLKLGCNAAAGVP